MNALSTRSTLVVLGVSALIGVGLAKLRIDRGPLSILPDSTMVLDVTSTSGIAENRFRFRSRATTPIQILGVALPCGCMSVSPLPCEIQPGEEQEFVFRADYRELDIDPQEVREKAVEESITFITDQAGLSPQMKIRLVDGSPQSGG